MDGVPAGVCGTGVSVSTTQRPNLVSAGMFPEGPIRGQPWRNVIQWGPVSTPCNLEGPICPQVGSCRCSPRLHYELFTVLNLGHLESPWTLRRSVARCRIARHFEASSARLRVVVTTALSTSTMGSKVMGRKVETSLPPSLSDSPSTPGLSRQKRTGFSI